MYAKPKLLIMTRQVGSVSVLEPILQEYIVNNWDYKIVAFDESVFAWKQRSFEVESKYDHLEIKLFSVILTGTSLHVDLDNELWELGKSFNIPTVGFLDSWVNYSERFTISKKMDSTPNYIAVFDQKMKIRMLECGIEEERLLVFDKHPRFNSLLKNFNLLKNGNLITIFTDPVLTNVADVEKVAGYSPYNVVKKILLGFKSHSKNKKGLSIVIKPHPREMPTIYQNIVNSLNIGNFVKVSTNSHQSLLQKSKCVIGMNTIVLLDSAYLGLPTYSFQPNRKLERNDITDREGIKLVLNYHKLNQLIEEIIDLHPAYSAISMLSEPKKNEYFGILNKVHGK
jgi:hypothetical protein